MDDKRKCPVCGRELIWETCDCGGRGYREVPIYARGKLVGTNVHHCWCCAGEGGWWTCPGVETEPAHQAEIRRQRRRAHLQEILVRDPARQKPWRGRGEP